MTIIKKREYHYRTDTHQFAFRANPEMTGTIKDLAAERHRSYSNTIRLLILLGLETYRNNATEGNTTSAKAQQAAAVRRAQAEAAAARKNQSDMKNVTSVTPLLWGFDSPEE